MTTRRGFLSLMLATASAPAIVKASSLMKIWVPPQEIIVTGNKFLTVDQITREALKILENNLAFSKSVNRSNLFTDGLLYDYSGPTAKIVRNISYTQLENLIYAG